MVGQVENLGMTVVAAGGMGGNGGPGGDQGGYELDDAYDGWEFGQGGAGTDGSPGGKGGKVVITATCALSGYADYYLDNMNVSADGGRGGTAGPPGGQMRGGNGVNNTKGRGGDAGEIKVITPSIKNAAFSVVGGGGGNGSSLSRMLHYAILGGQECNPLAWCQCCKVIGGPARSGDGNDGGSGGTVTLVSDGIEGSSVTAKVDGGAAGLSGGTWNAGQGANDTNCCYAAIDGAAGNAGAAGLEGRRAMGLEENDIFLTAGMNKRIIHPGECIETYVIPLTRTPKQNVSIRLKVPGQLDKVAADPNAPINMQNREVQWNIASL